MGVTSQRGEHRGGILTLHLRKHSIPSAPLPNRGPEIGGLSLTKACRRQGVGASFQSVSTLGEIEAAADQLPAEEKQELLLFLAIRLRGERGTMPQPRRFSKEEMDAWIAEDDADMRRLREEGM